MSAKFLTGIDLQQQRASNAADASGATDLITLQQAQALLNGLAWKQPVRVATTTNGSDATAFAAGQVIDGVTLTTGMRILRKDQTTPSENGVFTVNASGAPTRATDVATLNQLQNATVYVIAGTANADKSYTQTTNDVTPGTTAQTWVQQNAGQAYTAGAGLSLTNGAFAVVQGSGIIADGTSVRVDPAYTGLAKRYAQAIGDGSATSIVVTHSLGTADVDVTVRSASTGEVVYPDIFVTSTTQVTIGFASAPTASQYRVLVTA